MKEEEFQGDKIKVLSYLQNFILNNNIKFMIIKC